MWNVCKLVFYRASPLQVPAAQHSSFSVFFTFFDRCPSQLEVMERSTLDFSKISLFNPAQRVFLSISSFHTDLKLFFFFPGLPLSCLSCLSYFHSHEALFAPSSTSSVSSDSLLSSISNTSYYQSLCVCFCVLTSSRIHS